MTYYQHERECQAEVPRRAFNQDLPACSSTWMPDMRKYLSERHLSMEVALANGWYPSVDAGDKQIRIVIPATATPPNVFWQARLIDGQAHLGVSLPIKRYQSPHAPRGDAIIAVWPTTPGAASLAPCGAVVLVEGPMCALAAAELGFTGIALMGNSPPHAAWDLTL